MTASETKTIQERVAAGAAHLDQVRPGWYAEIDLDRLDLGQGEDCVLGQIVMQEVARHPDAIDEDTGFTAERIDGYDDLFNEDYEGLLYEIDDLSALVMTDEEAVARGFHVGKIQFDREWQALTDEWRRVILDRRENS